MLTNYKTKVHKNSEKLFKIKSWSWLFILKYEKNEKISKRLTEVWRSTHKGKKEEVLDKENSWWKEDF